MKTKYALLISALLTCAIINDISASDMLRQAKSYVTELFQGSTQKEKVADSFMHQDLMPESLYETFVIVQSADEQTKMHAVDTVQKHMQHLKKQIALLAVDKNAEKKVSFYFNKMNFGIVPRFNVYYMPNLFVTVMDAIQYKLPRERYALKFLRDMGDLANKMNDEVDHKNKEQLMLRTFIVQSLREFDRAFHPFVHAAKIPKASTLTKEQLIALINEMWAHVQGSEPVA